MWTTDTMSPQGYNHSFSESNSTCEVRDTLPWLFLPISYSAICCIGLLSNTISLFVFLRRHADTSMAVYMRHLTLADSLLVLCLPLRIYYHNSQGPVILCKLVGVFFYINMYASISFLSLISLDRYLKIIKPVWVFRIQKVWWSRITSYVIWAMLFIGNSLFFVGKKKDRISPCDKICFHFHDKGSLAGGINLAVVALFGVLIMVFIIFYVKIALKLRTMEMGNGDPKAQSRKQQLILKTYLVPAIFTLCFLPYHLVRAPYVLAQMGVIKELDSKQMLHSWNEMTLLLSTLNSCLDPIIYYFLSSTYRKTILCAIKGQFKSVYDLNRRRISINRSVTEI
ncbi:G protein-coupled receptor 34 like [Astyanax mexicanus]|uniref:Probable G-protein coupled receptor 34 n=1 Tax=Astyanax mexicanus TaxID=7994 RepID=A0A8T2L1X9_ASTMX|nr:G protein-coupled receptor 34 like [Astyanax mexicanus]KAG9265928.1 putative G-protein coupled receptor 34 [Astyanax mexicanus]